MNTWRPWLGTSSRAATKREDGRIRSVGVDGVREVEHLRAVAQAQRPLVGDETVARHQRAQWHERAQQEHGGRRPAPQARRTPRPGPAQGDEQPHRRRQHHGRCIAAADRSQPDGRARQRQTRPRPAGGRGAIRSFGPPRQQAQLPRAQAPEQRGVEEQQQPIVQQRLLVIEPRSRQRQQCRHDPARPAIQPRARRQVGEQHRERAEQRLRQVHGHQLPAPEQSVDPRQKVRVQGAVEERGLLAEPPVAVQDPRGLGLVGVLVERLAPPGEERIRVAGVQHVEHADGERENGDHAAVEDDPAPRALRGERISSRALFRHRLLGCITGKFARTPNPRFREIGCLFG